MSDPLQIIADALGSEQEAQRVLDQLAERGFVCVPQGTHTLTFEDTCLSCSGSGCQDCRGEGVVVTDIGAEILKFIARRMDFKV